MPKSELPDETRVIIDTAVAELRNIKVAATTRVVTQVVLRYIQRRREYDDTIAAVERAHAEVTAVSAVLARCADSLREAERRRGELDPGSGPWWSHRRRTVDNLLGVGETERAQALWRETWLDGLALGTSNECHEFIDMALPSHGATDLRRAMHVVTDALSSGDHPVALDHLDSMLAAPDCGRRWAATLGVLRTRILTVDFMDREVALQSATSTVDLVSTVAVGIDEQAADQQWLAFAYAGMAEVQLAWGELEDAQSSVDRALQEDNVPADAHVVAGGVAEQHRLWSIADKHYDEALSIRPGVAVRPQLLEPLPARLLVRAAGQQSSPSEAVDLLERALGLGVPGDGDYPDRDVYLAMAQLLASIAASSDADEPAAAKARADAAAAYFEAGNRYAWSGLTSQSIDLFDQACELAPERPSYHWILAEALRLDAEGPGGTVDRDRLREARRHLEDGYELGSPGYDEAWVLVTEAMINQFLPEGAEDPALTIERSLAKSLDPRADATDVVGYGFLAYVLRRGGFVQEALETVEQGMRVDPNESFLFGQLIALLRDLEEYDEAMPRIESQILRWPDDESLQLTKASLFMSRGEHQEALDVLASLEPSDAVQLTRAECLAAIGQHAESRAEYRALWLATSRSKEPEVAGWSAYRSGNPEEGIKIYERLVKRADPDLPYSRDLGQMHLVAGDLRRGRKLLLAGVEACPYVEELVRLVNYELKYVVHAVAGLPHQPGVEEAVAEVSRAVAERCTTLRTQRRPSDSPAVVAAAARSALHEGRHVEALHLYLDMLKSEVFPEALQGALFAGRFALSDVDQAFRQGKHDEALNSWTALSEPFIEARERGGPDLSDSLVARALLWRVLSGQDTGEDRAMIGEMLASMPQELAQASQVVAHSVDNLWALSDGLRRIESVERLDAAQRASLRQIVADLPLPEIYQLSNGVVADLLSYAHVNPLALHLGTGFADLIDSNALSQATYELQDRLSTDVGVRIPWVYVDLDDGLAADEAQLWVYERTVALLAVDPHAPSAVTEVMAFVESYVRAYLFRLIGVDDVNLWLEGWDFTGPDAPSWVQRDPQADRLRMARVLRMLLREGVPVRDRGKIVGVLESMAYRGEQGTLRALRDVRMALGRDTLGVDNSDRAVGLPEALESRARDGLNDKGTRWELDRAGASALVSDLRRWLAEQEPRPDVVTVEDPLVRPFVWRLVAAETPSVRVLSREELKS
jgi:tetratricopeptide (TPR) repeat protein